MTLSAEGMDLIFRKTRSRSGWHAMPVGDEQLRELYELMKCSTRTAANRCWAFR
jgi:hypothetical protein